MLERVDGVVLEAPEEAENAAVVMPLSGLGSGRPCGPLLRPAHLLECGLERRVVDGDRGWRQACRRSGSLRGYDGCGGELSGLLEGVGDACHPVVDLETAPR